MLRLKRMIHPFDFMFDSTGDILMFGDYYYQDDELDENGKRYTIRATTLYKQQQEKRQNEWDESILNNAESLREYEKAIKDAEHELAKNEALNKNIWGKDSQNRDREAGDLHYGWRQGMP